MQDDCQIFLGRKLLFIDIKRLLGPINIAKGFLHASGYPHNVIPMTLHNLHLHLHRCLYRYSRNILLDCVYLYIYCVYQICTGMIILGFAMSFGLFLSATDKKPMYVQIVEQVTSKVLLGDWPADMALPSIRELAAATQVSVITVKRAYTELEQAGVIVTQAGRGSFVSTRPDLQQQLVQQQLIEQLRLAVDLARQLQYTDEQILTMVQQQMNQS